MGQITFASMAYLGKKKVTRREKFLQEMERVLPWSRLEQLIEPVYPDIGNGRPPIGLRRMLRIYLMQQWFQLSDPAVEDALYDSESMRRFAHIELGVDAVPDETTILNFRHLLEKHDLTAGIFSQIQAYLAEHGLLLRQGSIVDATIIDAPASTKNKDKKRDPEMTSTKKGNQWYFGMKAHAGVDAKSGLVHTVVCTTASVHDSQVMDDLLHGQEDRLYGDKAYADNEKKVLFESSGGKWCIARKSTPARALSDKDKKWNRRMNKVRAKGEHPFRIVKDLWGYAKVRYRGIFKNACQIFTLFALANIFSVRHKLLKLRP